MPTYPESAELGQASHESNHSDASRESDLIDIVEFFWRSRKAIGISVLCCMVLGGAYGLIRKSTNELNGKILGFWTVQLVAVKEDQPDQVISAPLLNAFLKTRSGARAFYEGLAKVSGQKEFPIDVWTSRQEEGKGIIKIIEDSDHKATAVFYDIGLWSEVEAETLLPASLNNVVNSFNKLNSEWTAIFNEMDYFRMKIDASKIEALRLFERYSNLSPNVQRSVVEGLIKDLASTTNPDILTFLLSPVPESEMKKSTFIADYKKQLTVYESLQNKRKNLTNGLDLELAVPMAKFASKVQLIRDKKAGQEFLSRPLKELYLLLVAGSVVGTIAGIFIALTQSFWKTNASRLKFIFKES